jgi:hypothetical protein
MNSRGRLRRREKTLRCPSSISGTQAGGEGLNTVSVKDDREKEEDIVSLTIKYRLYRRIEYATHAKIRFNVAQYRHSCIWAEQHGKNCYTYECTKLNKVFKVLTLGRSRRKEKKTHKKYKMYRENP